MKLYLRFILLILLEAVSGIEATGQTADFTASITSGCAPIVVSFINTTPGCPACTCTWSLDNGTMPIHTWDSCSTSYDTAGTYTITLTVNNGGVITTHTVTVVVYPSPTVSFAASDTSICPGSSVTFTSTSIGGVPGPLTYSWYFGDGTTGLSGTPTKTYSTPGYYTIKLSVTNSEGCVSSLSEPAYIHVNPKPVPGFVASDTNLCYPPPTDATFAGTTTGSAPFSYIWSFGDGSAATGGSPVAHGYTATGTYDVKMVVTDEHGCMDSITEAIPIHIYTLSGSFTSPDTVCVNSSVSFTNTSGPHTSTTWNYGDGSPDGYSNNGSHTYASPGAYTVAVTVTNGPCTATVTRSIVVLPGPVTSFIIAPAHPCPPPIGVTFIGTAPSGSSIMWQYGDGHIGTGLSSTHTYADTGIYTISMVTTDSLTGCKSTVKMTDTFYDLHVKILPSDTSGCAPLSVSFGTDVYTTVPTGAEAPYPYGVASWVWSFGDGATSTVAAPTHTFTAPGIYNVTLTITTGNGCPATATVQIRVGTPPVVTFMATPSNTCYHDNEVSFTTTVITGPVSGYVWSFGDGTGSGDSSGTATYHYPLPGTYSATVIPYYNGCAGAPYVLTGGIVIDSPKAIARDSVLCSPVNTVDFKDLSLGDNSHVWIFGDGDTSSLPNPVHVYSAIATYTVLLATYNSASGCRDTASLMVNLSRPVVTFTANDTAICSFGHAKFTAIVTGGTATSYTWYTNGVLDGVPDTSHVFMDTFYTTGRFTITVVITDQNGCRDTFTRTNYELVAGPSANFTLSSSAGCQPLAVTFTDHSTDVAGTFFTRYVWAYGDGAVSTITATATAHTYTTSGSFFPEETVTDNIGCTGTYFAVVDVSHPNASFSASTTTPCANDSVLFTNTSSAIVSSSWTFGDGHTSVVTSPWHVYADTGLYTVTLSVVDGNGCTDTAVYTHYIHVTKPNASFYDDSVSICPPLNVNYINTSTGAVSYAWALGDGSTSTLMSPTDLYIGTGNYTVSLVATNGYGCTDTAIGHINIFGYAGEFSYTPDSGCVPLTVHFDALISNVPNIIWDFADGTTSAMSFTDSVSHTYLVPGAFVPKLILSDYTGCKSSSIGNTIKVDGVTPGFATMPDPVCLDGVFSFRDTSKSYWSTITGWSWAFNDSTSALRAPSFTGNAVGNFPATLTVTDGWGCTATLIDTVTVFPPPVITVSPDTTICFGDAATLTGYGGVSYAWSPPATLSCTNCNPTLASPTVVTQYTVTGTDVNGCSNTDTTTVLLKSLTAGKAWGDTQICAGMGPVPLFDSGGTEYTWYPPAGLSDPYAPDPLASPDNTTVYMGIAKLAGCKADTTYVTVTVHPIPTVYAGPDQNVVAGSTAQLNATGKYIYTYEWDNTSTLSCDDCPNPVASMTTATTYTVKVASSYGCTNSDTVTIHLYCANSQVFIPNSFTPNGDGQDDVFYPRGTGITIIKSFRIYNRWGQLLFERSGIQINDESNAWDGSYNGGQPRPDVYVYIVDAICDEGAPIFIKGNVTIIR